MIIYNVTVNVEKDIEESWVKWMKEKHIPDILATGFFNDHRMLRLLNETEGDGETYAIQYFTDELDNLERYMMDEAPRLRDEHIKKFQDKCVSFRTFLETV
ncbi:DUF4286 family protein [Marivirga arenosa]|uniref:DUF4286 family protein n=1 Tax=Marivirga arenosa TaxID=3059076 RepID=A0AA49GEC6_9BACT|nr:MULTISPECIES: DUF4286 family protein [unclassified Marivirga]WKK85426.1 DUF4286 family protein [Marivirga sp. ABR2-2]WNB17474.1 DUF4286 family protein [Marivirga sp. BKB1-2]